MLGSHVVFRQSVRRGLFRLLSTTAAETPRPRARGRPRKISIATAEEGCTVKNATVELPIRRGPGRPRKTAPAGDVTAAVVDVQAKRSRKTSLKDERSDVDLSTADGLEKIRGVKGRALKTTKTSTTKRARSLSPPMPPQKHWDLASFLSYAAKTNMKTNTCVYRGHHYEYIVAETLKRYNFTLEKTGRANDLGIDLVGTWYLPEEPREQRVLIQCKNSKPRPAFVRELAAAHLGAPAGWTGADVMTLLVTRDAATEGVRDALRRSKLPMCFMQITESGRMLQCVWNDAAYASRLTGMTATNEYRKDAGHLIAPSLKHGRLSGEVCLFWMGQRFPQTSLGSMQGLLEESQPESRLTTD